MYSLQRNINVYPLTLQGSVLERLLHRSPSLRHLHTVTIVDGDCSQLPTEHDTARFVKSARESHGFP